MALNFYSTNALRETARNLIVPPTFLLNSFFGMVQEEQTEDIHFDVEVGKRRVAPFVHPSVPSRRVDDAGFQTNTFRPAYIKDKREINPNEALRRTAGEAIGGSLTPAQRELKMIEQKMTDQLQMRDRRLEIMAASALLNGSITVVGEDYPSTVVDFNRAGAHSTALVGTAKWSAPTTADPELDFETWEGLILQQTGRGSSDVLMDLKSWQYFRAIDKVKARLDLRKANQENMTLGVSRKMEGATFQGFFGSYRIWTYSGWYINDAGSEVAIWPDYTVVMVGDAVEGVQAYGAIRDLKAGMQPAQYFFKSWEEEDPSVRWLLMQSAPLVYPRRPNATVKAVIHS